MCSPEAGRKFPSRRIKRPVLEVPGGCFVLESFDTNLDKLPKSGYQLSDFVHPAKVLPFINQASIADVWLALALLHSQPAWF
jgi:hypothetical protein